MGDRPYFIKYLYSSCVSGYSAYYNGMAGIFYVYGDDLRREIGQ